MAGTNKGKKEQTKRLSRAEKRLSKRKSKTKEFDADTGLQLMAAATDAPPGFEDSPAPQPAPSTSKKRNSKFRKSGASKSKSRDLEEAPQTVTADIDFVEPSPIQQ